MRPLFLLALVPLAACGGAQSDPVAQEAEAAVKSLLRDPGSAQFRDFARCSRPFARGMTGSVNARNSSGGYAGFVPFIFVDEQVEILAGARPGEDIMTLPADMARWDQLAGRCHADEAGANAAGSATGNASDGDR